MSVNRSSPPECPDLGEAPTLALQEGIDRKERILPNGVPSVVSNDYLLESILEAENLPFVDPRIEPVISIEPFLGSSPVNNHDSGGLATCNLDDEVLAGLVSSESLQNLLDVDTINQVENGFPSED